MVDIIRALEAPPPGLKGEQRPRLWTVAPRHTEFEPECKVCQKLDLKWGNQFEEAFAPGTAAGCGQFLGMDCLRWAKGVGYELFDWQKWVLLNAFGTDQTGLFSAMQIALIISRQNGKGTVLEVRELYGLFVLRENLIIHTAHELKTSKEHFVRICNKIEENPSLKSKLKGDPRKTNGQEQIELKKEPTLVIGPNGTRKRVRNAPRLLFVARSRGSARGFTADLIVYDEAMILSTESVGASLPTLSTLPNPQVWFTGSAGMEDSFQLARLHDQIKSKSKAIFGAEWSIVGHKATCPRDYDKGRESNDFVYGCSNPEHMDRDSPVSWAHANPTLGHLIQPSYIQKMELDTMEPVEFDRERLGIGQWPEKDAAWKVIAQDLWETLAVPIGKNERKGPFAFAVDVDSEGRNATVSCAWVKDGKIVVENMKSKGSGTHWVVEALKDWDRKYKPVAIIVPRSGAAAGLGDDIEKSWPDNPKWGTKVIRATVTDETTAFAWFTQQCKNKTKPLLHPVEEMAPRMYGAIGTAETRVVGDAGKTWSRKDSDSDIAPITSATLAAWGLNKRRRNYDLTSSLA